MLYLIGVGINEYDSLSSGSIEILKHSNIVYIERFTGFLSNEFIVKIKSLLSSMDNSDEINKIEIQLVKRWFLEDGKKILENSVKKTVCILVYGDPLIATTYNELLVRASKQSIPYKIIHSSSGISSLIGESGLHYYKFGKMVTMMSDPMSTITVYDTIYNNICLGLHTLILTEYNNDDGKNDFNSNNDNPFFLSPKKVFDLLMERENELKLLNLSENSFVIVACKIGTDNSKIIGGKIKSLINFQFESGPHSVIIPGVLHFTEIDSLKNLTIIFDDPIDNSIAVDKLSNRMLNKYIPNAKKALAKLSYLIHEEKNIAKNEYSVVLENAENYLLDAEHFYKQGKLELAILSVGYAEGLIDSLRFQKGMNPW
ncbi:MAG: diphthine synthase [Nitrosopumilus sp.]|nr:diphthine synthase [Nitrosopumilus sp.]